MKLAAIFRLFRFGAPPFSLFHHRCDAKKRRYIGAVCGLGCDPITGQSLFHDHDIELIFDTLVTQQDLNMVYTNCERNPQIMN